jgi:hypothetical protein
VGDYFAGDDGLGLAASTLVTGAMLALGGAVRLSGLSEDLIAIVPPFGPLALSAATVNSVPAEVPAAPRTSTLGASQAQAA